MAFIKCRDEFLRHHNAFISLSSNINISFFEIQYKYSEFGLSHLPVLFQKCCKPLDNKLSKTVKCFPEMFRGWATVRLGLFGVCDRLRRKPACDYSVAHDWAGPFFKAGVLSLSNDNNNSNSHGTTITVTNYWALALGQLLFCAVCYMCILWKLLIPYEISIFIKHFSNCVN